MLNDQEELAFREAAFAWIRAQQLTKPFFTHEDLSEFSYGGTTHQPKVQPNEDKKCINF
jgi:hypothetical protein